MEELLESSDLPIPWSIRCHVASTGLHAAQPFGVRRDILCLYRRYLTFNWDRATKQRYQASLS